MIFHDSWESANILNIQKIRTVCLSSVIRWTHSTWKLRSICIFRDLHCSTCAICCILRARAVHDLCLIRARSVRDPCLFRAIRAHDVFIGPGFEPLTLQHDRFVGPGFDSWAQSPVSGPCIRGLCQDLTHTYSKVFMCTQWMFRGCSHSSKAFTRTH